MPRPYTDRKCETEGCSEKHYAKGKCVRHYNASRSRSPQTRSRRSRPAVAPVVADKAWPDEHRDAPTGQRLALYTCPACGQQHLVSWLPFEEHPGLKLGTCRKKSAAQNAPLPQFFVLKPPDNAILTDSSADEAPENVENGETAGDGDFETREVTLSA